MGTGLCQFRRGSLRVSPLLQARPDDGTISSLVAARSISPLNAEAAPPRPWKTAAGKHKERG